MRKSDLINIINDINVGEQESRDALVGKRYFIMGIIEKIRKDDEKVPYDFLLRTVDNKRLCFFLTSITVYESSTYKEGTHVCILATRIKKEKVHALVIEKFSAEKASEMTAYATDFNNKHTRQSGLIPDTPLAINTPKEEKKVNLTDKKLPPQFYGLPEHIQNDIITQLSSSEAFKEHETLKYISDTDVYRLKYKLCKNTYPSRTQSTIEMLLSGRGGAKREDRLHYIMNINTGYTPEKITADEMVKELDKVIYGQQAAKEQIASAITIAKKTGKGAHLLLIGPGADAMADAIGNARKKPVVEINCSSITSVVDAAGEDNSYQDSSMGAIGIGFYNVRTSDATLKLYGFDLINHGNEKDGDPDTVFYSMLSEKATYSDNYIEADINVLPTFIIACCNDESKISPKILSRFTKIYLFDYTSDEKFTIAKEYILPKLFDECSWDKNNDVFNDETIRYVVENFCIRSDYSEVKDYFRKLIIKAIGDKQYVTGEHFTFDEIDKILYKDNLMNDPVFVYYANKDKFSSTDQKLIEKNITIINSPDKHDGSMEVAQTRLDYIADIYKHTVNPPSFDYDSFIKEVNSKISGRDELKSAFARMMNYYERTGKTKNILVIGPPGTGKTETFTAMSKAVGWPFNNISLNGVNKSDVLKGTPSFTHSGSPSEIVKSMAVIGDICILMLDEIDKIDRSQDTSVSSALLDFLDAKVFKDNYLGVHIDCKKVLVVATANNENAIAPELLDRFEVVRLNGYTKNEKRSIFTEYMLPRMLSEYKVSPKDYRFTDDAIDFLISKYSTTAGARELDTFSQKIIGEITMKYKKRIIDVSNIFDILGKPPIERKRESISKAGVVNGLSVNSYSGLGSLFEIQTVKSKTDKTLGMAQECLKESHEIAHVVAGMINADCTDSCYTTLYGDGATPKDGSSGGVGTVLSILSAETRIPIPSDYAFTGEISLMGYVHAVGGVDAKIGAAQEAGCTTVFIPKENYDYMGAEQFKKYSVSVIPVSHINEVVKAVFNGKSKNKRLAG